MKYFNWKNDSISQLCLGTVQLGMNYGIANQQGKPSEEQAFEIIELAWQRGINCFDTARGYGESEKILGKALERIGASNEAVIISKIDSRLNTDDEKQIYSSIEECCDKLRVRQLWGLLLHDPKMISGWKKGLGKAIIHAKEQGLLKNFGISVNSVDEAKLALADENVEIMQLPCNAWNQFALKEEIFKRAEQQNKLCFIRSIFLQGLLVLPAKEVDKKLPEAKNASEQWHEVAKEYDTTPEKLAFRFGLSLKYPLLVGVETKKQLEENLILFKQRPLPNNDILRINEKLGPYLSEKVITPFLWEQ